MIRSIAIGVLASWCAGCDVGAVDAEQSWRIAVVADDAGRVATGGPIRVAFDRRLSPWSVDRNTVALSSGTIGEFVFPWFDPLRSELVIELTRPLLVDTRYVLTLNGLQDLDGDALAGPKRILIGSSTAPTELPMPTAAVVFGEVEDLLVARCGGGDCHNDTDRAGEIVLDGAQGIADTARGRPSRQVASVHDPRDSRGAGLVNLPIIDADGASSSPSFSYLIYKVLGDAHVLGEAMPPPAIHEPLTVDELGLIARWIRTGAALE